MKRSGYADLPLHGGHVPTWLAERMTTLGGAIIEAIALDYGRSEVLKRLSDPNWFQSFGCVLGMDWHSSGITTSVMGALKTALNPKAHELGIYVCGGRGKHSRKTPDELMRIADRTGLNGRELVRYSKLTAKIDNTAIQDGYQLYLHGFVVTQDGEWAVIQQGMHKYNGTARRYHWHSSQLQSFINTPHTAVSGTNQGMILNLTATDAEKTREGITEIAHEDPGRMVSEIQRIIMPRHHEVHARDIDLKRLGSVLALAQNREQLDFESLLMLQGMGPRTLQSLTLVSEVIYGTPSRFKDPARYSFAHGGKDGHPFPVPTHVYDETIEFTRTAIEKAKLGFSERKYALQKLTETAQRIEKNFQPNQSFEQLIERENRILHKHGGRTVTGWAKPVSSGGTGPKAKPDQLTLF